MQKSLVWFLVALLFFASPASAFAELQGPRPRAFFEPGTDINTPEKYAQEIERCATDGTRSRASCDMLVASFNNAFTDLADVKDYKELANYFRTETHMVPCPQVKTRVAHVMGDRIAYSERELRATEMCSQDDNTQRIVSAGCGQWTPDLAVPARVSPPTPSTPANLGQPEKALVIPKMKPEIPEYHERWVIENDRSHWQRHKEKYLIGGAAVAGAILAMLFGSQHVEQTQIACINAPRCPN